MMRPIDGAAVSGSGHRLTNRSANALASLLMDLLAVAAFWCVSPQSITVAGDAGFTDLSAFTEFQFSRHPAFGFCPSLDSVFSAEISRTGVDDYLLRMSVLELGDGFPPEPDCLEHVMVPIKDACVKEVRLPERMLSSEEVEAMRAVFSRVQIDPDPNPHCGAVDPCVINAFSWDVLSLTTDPCEEPRLSFDESEALIAFLDSLSSTRDLSGFGQFRFARRPAFGFCPPLDEVFTAQIVQNLNPAGDYTLSMTVLEEGDRATDECLNDSSGFIVEAEVDCVKETRLADRILQHDELERVLDAFARVTVLLENDPLCGAIDPCVVNEFHWDEGDGVLLTDGPCSAPRLSERESGRLIDVLNSLRVPAPPIENGDVNGDHVRDISDPVFLLNWLFGGGPAPVPADCPPLGCPLEPIHNGDTNGDRAIDISDSLYLLNWLFGGGPAPVPVCSCAGS